jgi:hypothetical protein
VGFWCLTSSMNPLLSFLLKLQKVFS